MTIKAIFHTTVAKVRIKCYPGKKLHRFLGAVGNETGYDPLARSQEIDAYYVTTKVERVANRLPFENKCLVRAMVAQRLLKGYHLPSTLYLGVGKDKDTGAMVAHAWVRCGPYYITGGNGADYAAVAKFRM